MTTYRYDFIAINSHNNIEVITCYGNGLDEAINEVKQLAKLRNVNLATRERTGFYCYTIDSEIN